MLVYNSSSGFYEPFGRFLEGELRSIEQCCKSGLEPAGAMDMHPASGAAARFFRRELGGARFSLERILDFVGDIREAMADAGDSPVVAGVSQTAAEEGRPAGDSPVAAAEARLADPSAEGFSPGLGGNLERVVLLEGLVDGALACVRGPVLRDGECRGKLVAAKSVLSHWRMRMEGMEGTDG